MKIEPVFDNSGFYYLSTCDFQNRKFIAEGRTFHEAKTAIMNMISNYELNNLLKVD